MVSAPARVAGPPVTSGAVTMVALFTVAVLLGVGRAFAGPSLSALAPNLVPRATLPTARSGRGRSLRRLAP